MVRIVEGRLDAAGKRFGLVASRTNDAVTRLLVAGALDCLRRHGARDEDITLAWVPGSFEVPQLARRMAASGAVDAVVCLGALVRGETPHFDVLAAQVAAGAARAGRESGIPVTFGVLTVETLEQGMERAGGKGGNKGWDAALAAIEMTRVNDAWDAAAGRGRGARAKPRRAAR